MEIEVFLKKAVAEEPRAYGLPSIIETTRVILRGYTHSCIESDVSIISRVYRMLRFCIQMFLAGVVLYAFTVDFFAIHPLFRSTYFIFCVVIAPFLISFVGALFMRVSGHVEQSKRLRIHLRYAPRESIVSFTDGEYVAAARALQTWEPLYLSAAVKKYSQRVVDLCMLARAVDLYHGKVSRVVSLRAIEQDREAGWEE